VIYWLLAGVPSSKDDMGSVDRKRGYVFEAMPGLFRQDDPATDSETFDYVR